MRVSEGDVINTSAWLRAGTDAVAKKEQLPLILVLSPSSLSLASSSLCLRPLCQILELNQLTRRKGSVLLLSFYACVPFYLVSFTIN